MNLAAFFSMPLSMMTLHVILPVGISFYTFQTMSYTIDVYRKEIEPEKDFFDFALYVAFFPQLVAGPIERAKRLLPQITRPRTISNHQVSEGLFLIFWGLFKKILIADNLAYVVNDIFGQTGGWSSGDVLFACYAFAFQIYADFSGYTDIARGLAKLMGIELMLNFKLPYFALGPRDFWRRWHISLSTWLRDYLYIPLGGNQKGEARLLINLWIVMLLGGLWHGAAWNFVWWGGYHAILLCGARLSDRVGRAFNGRRWKVPRVILMFHLTCLGWLLFRAESITQFLNMTKSLFLNWSTSFPIQHGRIFLLTVLPLLTFQLIQALKKDFYWPLHASPTIKQAVTVIALTMIFILISTGLPTQQAFVYFQF